MTDSTMKILLGNSGNLLVALFARTERIQSEGEGQDDVMLLEFGGYHQRERNKVGEWIQL